MPSYITSDDAVISVFNYYQYQLTLTSSLDIDIERLVNYVQTDREEIC